MGAEQLDALIADLRRLEANAGEEIAKEAAPLIEQALQENAAAGLDPEGRAWESTKEGGRPLKNAAAAIAVRARGAIVELVLTGHHVIHHIGTKRLPERRILPDGGAGLPKILLEPTKKAARAVLERVMRGGRK